MRIKNLFGLFLKIISIRTFIRHKMFSFLVSVSFRTCTSASASASTCSPCFFSFPTMTSLFFLPFFSHSPFPAPFPTPIHKGTFRSVRHICYEQLWLQSFTFLPFFFTDFLINFHHFPSTKRFLCFVLGLVFFSFLFFSLSHTNLHFHLNIYFCSFTTYF